MRTIAIITVWIWYLISINYYIFTFGMYDQFTSKLIYLWPGFLTLIYCAIDINYGIVGHNHKCFLSLCMAGIAGNFLIMILYFQYDIKDYKIRFLIFNGISLLTSIFILISGVRNGLFKNKPIDT
jgi:hypothetical protein